MGERRERSAYRGRSCTETDRAERYGTRHEAGMGLASQDADEGDEEQRDVEAGDCQEVSHFGLAR